MIQININDIKEMISTSVNKILNEVVYADRNKINDKKRTIGITYTQNNNRANGNANPNDKLNTTKMDTDNGDTYEVPLKGGIVSYNITDISGTEIMHFFKHKWLQNKKVTIKILNRINFEKTDNKQDLTVLWLDDLRNPEEYFNKSQISSALIRNINFYKDIFNKYNVNWVWVKNLKEFQNYILNNPMPGLISFDYDLRPQNYIGDFENGGDVAQWFVEFCNKNNIQRPMCYAHTANKINGIPTLNNILGNEEKEVEYEYALEMEDNEINKFLERFKRKVEFVIKSWLTKNKNAKFYGISILPVDSSSNFNKIFVKNVLEDINIGNLEIKTINPEILKKDLRKVELDTDFIEKNKEFYNSNFAENNPEMGKTIDRVKGRVNRYQALNNLKEKLEKLNNTLRQIIVAFQINKQTLETERGLKRFAEKYKEYYDLVQECLHVTYYDEVTKSYKRINNAIIPKKSTKGPSVEKRKNIVWKLVKPFLRNSGYDSIDICYWELNSFEIKKLSNSERLGLKNIYNPNIDAEMVQQEIEKIKGTILLIFDDNISGGATLSDVCYQCKQLGVDNIIPITFGRMHQTNTFGRSITLNTPQNGYNFS